MVANCKSGLQVLNYDVEKNQLVKVAKGALPLSYSSGSTADGMDVTPKFAYIAAQGDGLYVFDLKKKQSWLLDCKNKKEDWKAFKYERYNLPPIPDPADI